MKNPIKSNGDKKMVRTQICFPPQIRGRINEAAAQEGIAVAELIRRAIKFYLDNAKKWKIMRKLNS